MTSPVTGRTDRTNFRTTEERSTVKSTVERLSPTRVRINVEVPFDELKPDFDRAYKKIAQQVKIPGFRPGKAPARCRDACTASPPPAA